MKEITKNITVVFGLLATTTIVYSQVEKRVKPEIKAATIYTQGATVSAEVRTEAEAGFTKLIVTGLPNDLNQNQIKVSGKGDAAIASVVYQNKPDYLVAKTKELIQAEDSLDHLQFEMDSLKHVIEALKEEEKLLLANNHIGGENVGLKSTELEDVADVYRERLVQIKNLTWKTEYRKRKLNDKYQKLKTRVRMLQDNRQKLTGELAVTVQASAKTAILLHIDYFTRAAGWQPAYDIKVKSTTEPIQWVFKANVQQLSGQTWKDVKLTLSTYKPEAQSGLPLFKTQRLRIRENVPAAAAKKATMRMYAGAVADAAMEEEAAMPPMPTATTVQESENDFSVVYEIKQDYTLHSQPQAQQVEIMAKTVTGRFLRVAMPKYNGSVFLTAMLTDWEKLNLIPGDASVFWAGAYSGQTYINPSAMGDTLTIALAKDPGVLVTKETIKDYTSKKLLGQNKVDEYGYMITVKNTHKTPVDVKLVEQIPISGDQQIQVEYKNESQATWEQDTGKLTWQMNLGATESKKIIYRYSVKYPKSVELEGY